MNSIVDEFFKEYSRGGLTTVYTEKIPKEMLAGPVSDSGWVPWKLIEGKLTRYDYEQVGRDFNLKFPESFITWHRSYFFLDADCSIIRLPASLPTEPLKEIKQRLGYYRELLDEGLIPFASEGNDSGPLVFETRQKKGLNEYPIKLFDQDAGDLSDIIFSSFPKLLQCITHFLKMTGSKKNFEIIPDFYLIDSEGAGTKSGMNYWNSWIKMMKANYEEFGY